MSAAETIRAGGFTPQQQEAISARGNLLVSAGAGTGKTRTLVARCLRLVAGERVSFENILMVTFTESAAAEMRGRIRKELRELQSARPDDSHLAQQLALLDSARISTLHGFCLQLIREHFHAVGLDPQFTVLDGRQTRPLMRATLDDLFERHYADAGANGRAVRALVRAVGGGTDNRIRRLVANIHTYSQSLPDPAAWLGEQQRNFEPAEPVQWREWFLAAVAAWREEWNGPVAAFAGHVRAVQLCHDALKSVSPQFSRDEAAKILRAVEAADSDGVNWPHGTKGKFREPLEKFFNDARFLVSLLPDGQNQDPLAQDWEWTRHHMTTLVSLAREFTGEFSRAKRELGGLDFADLEQYALRLLRDPAVAGQWRERLTHVFVDEYQDINEAQDKIITALSRAPSADGTAGEGNRFLVGDVKQSIYRFRLAKPKIFSDYSARWSRSGADGRRLALTGNFRSRAALLNFINPLFEGLMRPAVGGIDYEALDSSAPIERDESIDGAGDAPGVELHVIARPEEEAGHAGADEEVTAVESAPDLLAVEREARLVARRLQELKDGGHPVWDEERKSFRPVRWSDMAVLLRSPAGRAEAFAREFNRAKIPLVAARDGFFQSLEISDLLNLLKLLDNPLQDVPLLAVLRSPLVGFSLNELAEVRAHNAEKPFWTALAVFHRETAEKNISTLEKDAPAAGAWRKADLFLRQLAGWRELVRQSSLSQCLETALVQTHYEALLQAEPRGEERRVNVHRLLDLARQFDPYQRQGLYRFLRFVEAQEQEELDLLPALPPATDAVRLMSIHKSKGLEFPVVVLACLGTRFNEQDLSQPVLLNEEYGLCPRITPPDLDQSYPGLPYWLARRRERGELRGEELRLLYVALTRARDLLILTGVDHRKASALKWKTAPDEPISTSRIVDARGHLDWFLLWLPHATVDENWSSELSGQNEFLRWRIHDSNDPLSASLKTDVLETGVVVADNHDAAAIDRVTANLAWEYPFATATVEPAKTSVSVLRRRHDQSADEARPLFQFKARPRPVRDGVLSAAETGRAHHTLLQFIALDKVNGVAALRAEAERLRDEGVLTEPEFAALDLAALNHFWQSDFGRKVLAQRGCIHREIPFTARFSPADLAEAGVASDIPQEEFVVVQGVADLAVILPKEIWIVDFKTDAVEASGAGARAKMYEPQLKLYALALARIYGRTVTECALYFLSPRALVSIEVPSAIPTS